MGSTRFCTTGRLVHRVARSWLLTGCRQSKSQHGVRRRHSLYDMISELTRRSFAARGAMVSETTSADNLLLRTLEDA